ncbi:MAG: FecR domain-containing protein [Flavobacterium sp.]|nr:FecR domain-containing protein [Flavobacterium sp.]
MLNATKDTNYYQQLAEKLLNGTISPKEEMVFFDWYNSQQDTPIEIPILFAKSSEALKQRIWQNIKQQQTPKKTPLALLSFLTVKNVAAATIVTILGVTTIYLLKKNPSTKPVATTVNEKPKPILPGGNKATLTLANGEVVALDDANNGQISSQGNVVVVKLKSGLLSYQQVGTSAQMPVAAINVLSTPRGGQYQVELPDGSKVWLNSYSSLKYPTFFSGKERVVELNGEGYFEVAKNKDMPFKVKVNNMEVAVLGTHFNIMAYNNESSINTTLLEGLVKISTPKGGRTIKPGEQAKLATSGTLSVVNAEIEEAMAWKNGFFQFNSADMQTVIRQINRWYDVDIVYNGDVDAHFTGTISRSVEADKVLKKLQLTGAFKYEIRNKQVFITK